jgi:membrane protein DedA with SNARE-associated domain
VDGHHVPVVTVAGHTHLAAALNLHGHHRFPGPGIDYVALGLVAAVSWLVVTGPGEAALVAAGIIAARHQVDVTGALAVAWSGATLGGSTGWLIGRLAGRPLMERPGPLARVRRRLLRSGDRIYARHGTLAVVAAPSWMAGINRMGARRFLVVNAAAALLWTLALGLGAYYVGPGVTDVVDDAGVLAVVVLAALGASTVVRPLWRRRRSS